MGAPRDLSAIAWSVATFSFRNRPLMSAMAAASIRRIHQFDPPSFASLSWSLAVFECRDQPLIEAISKASRHALRDDAMEEDLSVTWSSWRLGYAISGCV